MLRYQIRTGEKVAEKIEEAGGDDSLVKRILDGLRWRLAHDENLGTVVDEVRKVYLLKSHKLLDTDPVVLMLYKKIDDSYYDMEITDFLIIP